MTYRPRPTRLGAEGIALIKLFEGLELAAYQDGAGIWTIGYGTTKGVYQGMMIDEGTAEDWLRRDVELAEAAIRRNVTVSIHQNQFDAMISFIYNVGIGGFKRSTMLKRLNRGDDHGAAEALEWFNKIRNPETGKLRVSNGLKRRRAAERKLFERRPQDEEEFIKG